VVLDFSRSRAFALAKGERDFAGFAAIPLSTGLGLCCFVELRLLIKGRELTGRFLIDTGAPSVELVLTSGFVQKHNLASPSAATPITFPTLCATTSLLPYDGTARLRIGNFTLHNVSVLLSRDRAGSLAEDAFDGVIGGALLRRFEEIVIDGPRARVLLKFR